MATVDNIDTEAFALGSYYCQVACIFRLIHLLSADYFLLQGATTELQFIRPLICGNDPLHKTLIIAHSRLATANSEPFLVRSH